MGVIRRIGIQTVGAIPVSDMGSCPSGVANPWYDPNGDGLCVWAAYQPKGAASLAASYTDLSGNGNNAGVGVAPTWDAVNGWIFNGTTQYLTTTFVPAIDQSQSILVQYTNATNNNTLFGLRENGNRVLVVPNSFGTVYYRHGTVAITQNPVLLAGNLGIAGNAGYRNGVLDTGALTGFPIAPTLFIYIAAQDRVGATGGFGAAYIQAFVIYDCTLTAPQVLAVATAMAAL